MKTRLLVCIGNLVGPIELAILMVHYDFWTAYGVTDHSVSSSIVSKEIMSCFKLIESEVFSFIKSQSNKERLSLVESEVVKH